MHIHKGSQKWNKTLWGAKLFMPAAILIALSAVAIFTKIAVTGSSIDLVP